MESLCMVLSSSSPFLNHPKPHKLTSKYTFFLSNFFPNFISTSNFTLQYRNPHQIHFPFTKRIPCITQTPTANHQSSNTSTTPFSNHINTHLQIITKPSVLQIFLQSHVSFLCMRLSFPLSCFASETTLPTEEVSDKINLEAIVVSIDDFFNRNPFFVAGVTFIWLIVIPLTQEYLQKYKFISAIDSFRKLRDDPNSRLLDIRDKKSLGYLGSPNLKILNKGVVQVEFSEGEEEGFTKNVLGKFSEPENTTICILDNFDGNSMKVAELLVNNGFKEAYAIRGGTIGKNGWQAIQESLLPPSVHIYPTKKVKKSKRLQMNGGVTQKHDDSDQSASVTNLPKGIIKQMDNGHIKSSIEPTPQTKLGPRSLSPYPNYPDMKPPSSPTPSKPQN